MNFKILKGTTPIRMKIYDVYFNMKLQKELVLKNSIIKFLFKEFFYLYTFIEQRNKQEIFNCWNDMVDYVVEKIIFLYSNLFFT